VYSCILSTYIGGDPVNSSAVRLTKGGASNFLPPNLELLDDDVLAMSIWVPFWLDGVAKRQPFTFLHTQERSTEPVPNECVGGFVKSIVDIPLQYIDDFSYGVYQKIAP
jgi:hypothetical protein